MYGRLSCARRIPSRTHTRENTSCSAEKNFPFPNVTRGGTTHVRIVFGVFDFNVDRVGSANAHGLLVRYLSGIVAFFSLQNETRYRRRKCSCRVRCHGRFCAVCRPRRRRRKLHLLRMISVFALCQALGHRRPPRPST